MQNNPRRKFRGVSIFLLIILLVSLLPGPVAAAPEVGAPPTGVSPAGISPAEMLNADGTLNLDGSFYGTLDLAGWQVSLDEQRGPVFSPAESPAAVVFDTWFPLAENGLNNRVRALAVIGSDLYVGGDFADACGNDPCDASGTAGLNKIAKYSTVGGTWSALAENGLDNDVYALAVIGSDLYVGGLFSDACGNDPCDGSGTAGLTGIAKYSAGAWSALAENGLNNTVVSLAAVGSDLYVGGGFKNACGSSPCSPGAGDGTDGLNNIAKYSAGAWSALAENGLNSGVTVIAVLGSDLYVGGWFTDACGNDPCDGSGTAGLNQIAKYSSGAWSALAENGLSGSGSIWALAVIGSDLYVGGYFTDACGNDPCDGSGTAGLNNIAKYSSGAWSALAENGLNNQVSALAVIGSDLYVGGSFTDACGNDPCDSSGTAGLNQIAKYSSGAWSAMAENGLDNDIRTLKVMGAELYAGGSFTDACGNDPCDSSGTAGLNKIANYEFSSAIFTDGFESGDLSAWSSASANGGDLSAAGSCANNGSYGMAALIDDQNSIYVTDTTPSSEDTYRASFYLDPNSLTMNAGSVHNIFIGKSGSTAMLKLIMTKTGGGAYQIRARVREDSGSWKPLAWVTITDDWHKVTLEWQASSGAGANNGYMLWWIDDAYVQARTGLDNDTHAVTEVRLGVPGELDVGTSGTLCFDDFVSDPHSYTQPSTAVFSDGFESGNFTAWSNASTGGGDLYVNGFAAITGSFGMRADIDDQVSLYVTKSGLSETVYRVQFALDPYTLTMNPGSVHNLFIGKSSATAMLKLIMTKTGGGQYQIRARVREDSGTWRPMAWTTISDAPHTIELEWHQSGGSNNGYTVWRIDGVIIQIRDLLDNDTHTLTEVRLGVPGELDVGTSGALFFDDFASWD